MLYDVCVKIKQLFLNINDNFITSKKVLEAIEDIGYLEIIR